MKRIIITITIISLLNLIGCYSYETISLPEYHKIEKENGKPKEIFIVTKDSTNYFFNDWAYNIRNDTLIGKGTKIVNDIEQPFEGNIPLTEIESFQLEEINITSVVIVLTVLALSIAATIAAANAASEFRGR